MCEVGVMTTLGLSMSELRLLLLAFLGGEPARPFGSGCVCCGGGSEAG